MIMSRMRTLAVALLFVPAIVQSQAAATQPAAVQPESIPRALATKKPLVATTKHSADIAGKKVDYTSIPYSKIQTFSVETAGVMDLECELEIYISSIGKIRFEIRGGFDIVAFNKVISEYVLGSPRAYMCGRVLPVDRARFL